MTKTGKNTLLQKISPDILHLSEKKIIVACSGGPDSMVLLDLLCKSKEQRAKSTPRRIYDKEQNYSDSIIVVAHVNHQLRETALRDEKIVRDYCEKNTITIEVLTVDIKKEAKKTKTTVEECARNIRIQWLEEIRLKHHADLIMTAHHSDDQAETILYRITKGTGITGLVGIE
jgi:bifunctional protein TilS/HprT